MSPPLPQPRNIYIVGAQCTGKTTLVNALERFFKGWAPTGTIKPPRIVTEVARTVLRENNFQTAEIRDSPTRSFELQKLILQKQYEAEDVSEDRWIISDRSAVDPVMYAKHHAGEDAHQILLETPEWRKLERKMRSSVVIVCQAVPAWLKDDGVRLMPKDDSDWTEFHNIFCDFLTERKIPFVILPNSTIDLDSRVKFVFNLWQASNSLNE